MTTSDNEWQRVVQRVTTCGTTSDNEWQRVITSGTTSGNEWQQVVQRVTTSGTTSDKEWKWVTNSDNKWQWMTASENSGTANENGTVHFMDDCHHFNNKKRYTTASN